MKYLKLYESFHTKFSLKEGNRYWDNFYKEKDDVIDFINLVINAKGSEVLIPFSTDNFSRINQLKIHDTINNEYVEYLLPNRICKQKLDELTFSDMRTCAIKKLNAIANYLKKKYPDIAVGKEWGFFDLEK